MSVLFYPQEDELISSDLEQKLEVLLEAARRYKALVLDSAAKQPESASDAGEKRRMTPRDMTHSYNWEEIAKCLREIRELSEGNPVSKQKKATSLKKLAEIYEVLRGAKMAKLEAVRIALANEASQLTSGGSQVA